jgi:hypothetical protein
MRRNPLALVGKDEMYRMASYTMKALVRGDHMHANPILDLLPRRPAASRSAWEWNLMLASTSLGKSQILIYAYCIVMTSLSERLRQLRLCP